MLKKIKDKIQLYELIFTIALAISMLVLGMLFFEEEKPMMSMFNSGVDQIGVLVCAALIYGCSRQKAEGSSCFRVLIIILSLSFAVNEGLSYTINVPEMRTVYFILCLVNGLLDIGLIFFFYRYVRKTLEFKGKLAVITDKIVTVLMVSEFILELSNIFYPLTFKVSAEGNFERVFLSVAEDIILATVSILTFILICRSNNPRKQKFAAAMFIFCPLLEYALTAKIYGNVFHYGMILVSLIIMYCVIFNEKSQKIASTEIELDMATQIQTSMLPDTFPLFPDRQEFDVHASMDPAKEVGGDFYDIFMIDEDHLALVIADVSGKGVPAALFMMSAKILINSFTETGATPAEILGRVNKQVCANNKANMFVTVWLGILEISTGKLTTANAGHEYPIINVNGSYEIFKDKHGLAIGAMNKAKYVNHEMTLKKGDSIFVYTDGVAEATDSHLDLFGTERTIDALNAMPKKYTQKEILKCMREAVDGFVKEAPQFDDITMLGLKYHA